jgi:murein L,D-transpeptidase YcbB/YkuD
MERWRWMPDDLGARHLLVNIPAFHMAAREHGRTVLDMKVVVGTTAHKTPIFSGDMATVVFSPYWNVPESIAEVETAPAAARDPGYLARNHIDILRVSKGEATVVDPSRVDWDDPEEVKTLSFRQRPGADNALGHVKFLFPNTFDVYLHDTPADALFARPSRALSHGCVRLERPEDLAKYVLRDRTEWDAERIEAAMLAGTEKHVTLEDKIPVHIVYFTVWPNATGGVDSWPDVYGYDAKQAQ